MTENTIRLEHRLPHPTAAVWAALTTPDLLARWWAPGDIAPVVGHRFTMGMGNGWPGLLSRIDGVLSGVSCFGRAVLVLFAWTARSPL
jgi:uncharacterized protein YndB with AHSA1/START domain